MEYREHYNAFKQICRLMINNKPDQAKPEVEKYIMETIDEHTPNDSLLSHIIASSLLKRIDRKLLETKNIYLQQFDIPQIALFYEMVQAYPHVGISHYLANQYQESIIKDLEEVTIFDIGIGRGMQLEALITNIIQKNYNLRKLTIIGLDCDENNLIACNDLFKRLNHKAPFHIHYYPSHTFLESYDEHHYAYIKEIAGDNLIINAAYAMHHVTHPLNDDDERTAVFKKLAALDPLLFTLIEPNSNHDEENLIKRLTNCWNHFGTVFKLIDQSKISREHKLQVKDMFFAREIKDIFGTSDYLRTERHEACESWMLRLVKAGFIPYDYHDIMIALPDYCSYDITEGMIELGYDGLMLIGVFAYTTPFREKKDTKE